MDLCDVVVVGGRVAGSLAAILFARAGLDVVVVGRATFPSPTLSTHFFRGDGLIRVLDRAGLLPDVEALGAPRLTREYVYANGDAGAALGPPQDPGRAGYDMSVRRVSLDVLLIEGARESGVRVLTATAVARWWLGSPGRPTASVIPAYALSTTSTSAACQARPEPRPTGRSSLGSAMSSPTYFPATPVSPVSRSASTSTRTSGSATTCRKASAGCSSVTTASGTATRRAARRDECSAPARCPTTCGRQRGRAGFHETVAGAADLSALPD